MLTDTKSLKRARSPSPAPSLPVSIPTQPPLRREEPDQHQRAPKRMRRMHAADPISPSTIQTMAANNPLSRRRLKRDAKKERRAGRTRRTGLAGASGGMEVECDDRMDGLDGTFFTEGSPPAPTITELL